MSTARPRWLNAIVATLGAVFASMVGLWLWLPEGTGLSGAVPELDHPFASRADLRRAIVGVAHTAIRETPAEGLPWNWGEGVLLLGLQRAATTLDDPRVHRYVQRYYAHHRKAGIEVSWSDDTTPAIAAAERIADGEQEHMPLVNEVVAYVMDAPRTARKGLLVHLGTARLPGVRALLPEVWVDTVFHVVPTLMRYSELTDDPQYRTMALTQLRLFLDALQDRETRLVTHAYNDGERAERVPPFANRAFWARGNGWMLATLADALAHTPQTDPAYATLRRRAGRLASALSRSPTRAGLYHTLLLDKESYLETAGSTLIHYGLLHGARTGLWPKRTDAAAARARKALAAVLRRRGERTIVTGTSLGTNPIEGLYGITPTADQVPYGVGAWLMAACELYRVTGT